jgi:hypothetical protein
MQVSKTHATVYWGQGGEWDDGWFIVDTGKPCISFSLILEAPTDRSRPICIPSSLESRTATAPLDRMSESWTTSRNRTKEMEEGEIEDDVGWGALMDGHQLEQVLNPPKQATVPLPVAIRDGIGGRRRMKVDTLAWIEYPL